jgi:hypothetical protein
MHLAITKRQDLLRDAETARAARAAARPQHERPQTWLATAWHRGRRAFALRGPAATTTVLRRRRFRVGA